MRVVFALALLGLFLPASWALEAVRGPWPVRAMTGPEPVGAGVSAWHWWRSDQGQYFLASAAQAGGVAPAAAPTHVWALEGDPGGRACPRLKAQSPERLQEPELHPLPDEELALPPVKIHCSILAEDAIKAAVADYRSKHGSTETETPICAPVAP